MVFDLAGSDKKTGQRRRRRILDAKVAVWQAKSWRLLIWAFPLVKSFPIGPQRGAGEPTPPRGQLMHEAMLSAGPYLLFSRLKYQLTESL